MSNAGLTLASEGPEHLCRNRRSRGASDGHVVGFAGSTHRQARSNRRNAVSDASDVPPMKAGEATYYSPWSKSSTTSFDAGHRDPARAALARSRRNRARVPRGNHWRAWSARRRARRTDRKSSAELSRKRRANRRHGHHCPKTGERFSPLISKVMFLIVAVPLVSSSISVPTSNRVTHMSPVMALSFFIR